MWIPVLECICYLPNLSWVILPSEMVSELIVILPGEMVSELSYFLPGQMLSELKVILPHEMVSWQLFYLVRW